MRYDPNIAIKAYGPSFLVRSLRVRADADKNRLLECLTAEDDELDDEPEMQNVKESRGLTMRQSPT